MRMNFRNWLAHITESSSRTTLGKQSLYCAAYTMAELRTPPANINMSADSITYFRPEDLKFKMIWGKGILDDPSKEKD